MPKRLPLSDQVRRAVDASGMSRYRISKELDISEATMRSSTSARTPNGS